MGYCKSHMKYNSKGGQIKQVKRVAKTTVKTAVDIVDDLLKGLSGVIGGVSNGIETVSLAAGDVLNNISSNMGIVSKDVLSSSGEFTMKIAKDLGEIVEIIPILGRPVGVVVKGTGKGIFYVVSNVGNVTKKTLKKIGKTGKVASKIVVFTVSTASDATEKALKQSRKLIKDVFKMNGNKKN